MSRQAVWHRMRAQAYNEWNWDHTRWINREPKRWRFISHWLWSKEEPKKEDYIRDAYQKFHPGRHD